MKNLSYYFSFEYFYPKNANEQQKTNIFLYALALFCVIVIGYNSYELIKNKEEIISQKENFIIENSKLATASNINLLLIKKQDSVLREQQKTINRQGEIIARQQVHIDTILAMETARQLRAVKNDAYWKEWKAVMKLYQVDTTNKIK